MIDTQTAPPGHTEEARERSLPEDVRELVNDARDYAKAEYAFQKSRASFASKQSAIIAGYGAAALLVAYFAMIALVVGAVIALGEALTPWAATAIVTAVLLALSALLAWLALSRFNRMKTVLRESEGDGGEA